MYRITYILAALSLSLAIQAQDKPTYREVDELTYGLYVKGDWHGLIREGKEAIRGGIDYYYLRMRIGIAYYELHRYQSAIPHFEKALAENPDNPAAQEYMYYAYLFSGRQMDALHTAEGFSAELAEKTGLRPDASMYSVVPSFTWAGYDTDEAILQAAYADAEAGEGFRSIPKSFALGGLTISHKLGSHVLLSHSLQFMGKTNYLSGSSGGQAYTVQEQHITQFQYYLSPLLRLAKGLTLAPAFHFVSYRVPGLLSSAGGGGRTSITPSVRYNDFVTSLAVNKALPYVNAGLSFAYGTLNGARQYQPAAELTFFPLGNLNLYSTFRAYLHKEFYEGLEVGNATVVQNTTGFKVLPWLWAEAEGSWGDQYDFTEYNGSVVYNSLDVVNGRYAGRLIAWLREGHLQIVLTYNRYDYTNYYHPDSVMEGTIPSLKYSSNIITGGIIWKP